MTVRTERISLASRGNAHMIDVTGEVRQAVAATGLADGIATIFTPSATSALTTIEYEPGAVADFTRLFDEIAAQARDYEHNRRIGDGNAHSHVRAALLGPSLTIPVVDGKLTLGIWQEILFVDFDVRARERTLVVQVIGETASM